MGRDVSGPEFFEGRVTAYLEAHLSRLGVPYETVETARGRANVLARLDAPGAARTVLLDAHQDTVPVDGMTIPPFEPAEREGRAVPRFGPALQWLDGVAPGAAASAERGSFAPEFLDGLAANEEALHR